MEMMACAACDNLLQNCKCLFQYFVCFFSAADLPLFLIFTQCLSRVVGKCITQLSSGTLVICHSSLVIWVGGEGGSGVDRYAYP